MRRRALVAGLALCALTAAADPDSVKDGPLDAERGGDLADLGLPPLEALGGNALRV
jgi:hypothetical protein